jgi:hypothetical protein
VLVADEWALDSPTPERIANLDYVVCSYCGFIFLFVCQQIVQSGGDELYCQEREKRA